MSNDVKGGWTPGPWVWHSREGFASNYEWECETLRDAADHVLISLEDIYPGYAECGEHLVMKVDPKVARLIAAAPELFEALQVLLEFDGISAREQARAALAKATGGTSTP